MSQTVLRVGSFYVPRLADGSLSLPSSSSSSASASDSTLLAKVERLGRRLAIDLEVISAFQSPDSLSAVDGQVYRVSFLPDWPSPAAAAAAAAASGKGKGRALGKRQAEQAAKELGALLAEVLVELCQSPELWEGEVVLDAAGDLLATQPALDPAVAWDGRSLQQIYSSLPSPSPLSTAPFSRVGSPAYKAVIDLLNEVDQDLWGMRTRLFGYQVTDVKQMVLWELANPPISDLAFVELQTVDGAGGLRAHPYFVSLGTGRVAATVDRYASPRGGILCEEMGFGKTVCVLALILATKSQRADVPEGMRVETSWLRPPTNENGQPDVHLGRIPRLTDLAAHRLLSSPFQSIHPSDLEAGSSGLAQADRDYLLNLLEFGSQQPYYWAPSREMRGRMGANDVCREVPILLSWASLVIVPDNLLLQWKGMLEKHVEEGALRSLVIENNADVPAAGVLAQDYDVVFISHGCFAREHQRGGFDSASTTSRPCKCYVGRNEGEQCACTPPASPLVRVRWKRLVVDEGHVASSKTSDLVRLASLLSAERVWVVSGTPTPNLVGLGAPDLSEPATAEPWPAQAKVDLSRLQAMSAFLKIGELSSSSFASLISAPLHAGSDQRPEAGAVHRLDGLLQRIMVRHRLEDLSDAPLPPLHISSVAVSPSVATTKTLNVLLAIMHVNSLSTGRSGDGWLFSSASTASLQHLFGNLSYAAFWLGSPNVFDVDNKRWWAHDEATAMDHGERQYNRKDQVLLRDTFLHLERAGSDRVWQQLVGSFGASLPARLRGLDDELARAWGGLQPAGWTDHLLLPAKLIRLRNLAVAHAAENPGVEPREMLAYLIAEGRTEQAEEAYAERRRAELASGKHMSAAWWSSEKATETQRMAKAKQRSVDRSDPFPETPIVSSSFPLLDARIVSTVSAKLNFIIAEVLRHAEHEKMLVFSRDASALGLLTEAFDLVGVPADFVGGIMSRNDRQRTVSSFEVGQRTRVLLIELTQGARGLNLASASRVIFCEPVPSADIEMQAIKRAHRVGQTRDVHVQTLVTSGTFEEEIARQHGVQQDCQLQQPYRQRPRSKSATKVTLTKGLPSDKRVTDLLRDAPFLSTDAPEDEASAAASFDVPFWLSGTHHQTMAKIAAGQGLSVAFFLPPTLRPNRR